MVAERSGSGNRHTAAAGHRRARTDGRRTSRGACCATDIAPSDYNRDPAPVAALVAEGGEGARRSTSSSAALDASTRGVADAPGGRVTETVLRDLAEPARAGRHDRGRREHALPDDIRRAQELDARGIHYLDCGTSGGVFGLERGYCLMVGGDEGRVPPARADLRVARPRARRRAAQTRAGRASPRRESSATCTAAARRAGHFVKMVHNGIEYGLMAAYAEGFNLLHHADAGLVERAADAETAPLAHPERYSYELDVAAIAELWRRGSVVSSWLLDLAAAALHESPGLDGFGGRVSDSGEGRWTSIAAIETGRADAGPRDRTLLALLVARRGRLREPRPVGDAEPVRRTRGEDRRDARARGPRGRGWSLPVGSRRWWPSTRGRRPERSRSH